MPAAYTTMLSVQEQDFRDICLLIQHDRLKCDSCTSGQRFAFGFLQIPPHDEHPCRSASSSPCRACRGLPPPSECALPGAQKERGGLPQAAAPPPGQGSGHLLQCAAAAASSSAVAALSTSRSWRNSTRMPNMPWPGVPPKADGCRSEMSKRNVSASARACALARLISVG